MLVVVVVLLTDVTIVLLSLDGTYFSVPDFSLFFFAIAFYIITVVFPFTRRSDKAKITLLAISSSVTPKHGYRDITNSAVKSLMYSQLLLICNVSTKRRVFQ